jgi:hypothetical protein
MKGNQRSASSALGAMFALVVELVRRRNHPERLFDPRDAP